jgi:hypothetical protein
MVDGGRVFVLPLTGRQASTRFRRFFAVLVTALGIAPVAHYMRIRPEFQCNRRSLNHISKMSAATQPLPPNIEVNLPSCLIRANGSVLNHDRCR